MPPPAKPGREAAAEVWQDFRRAALRGRAAPVSDHTLDDSLDFIAIDFLGRELAHLVSELAIGYSAS